jgi:outer membrane cobalamin receptor
VSNEYGFFSLSLPAGPVQLRYSYLGYQPEERVLDLRDNQRFLLALQPTITLAEVVVYPRDTVANPIGGLASGNAMRLREMELLPSLAGEPDVLRMAHLLPGVTTGSDGAEGLHVRGGDNGQNLVLLDGVPVYNVSHGFGFFSRFNTNALRSAQLLRGGFPARYSGRLSSVIDVRTKEGNDQRLAGSAETGLLSTRFSLEGPIRRGQSSFFVSGRWSFLHWLLRGQSEAFKQERGRDGFTDYRFYDLNLKLNHRFSDRDRVYLSMYQGRDQYEDLTTIADQFTIRQPNGNIFDYAIQQRSEEDDNWDNTVGSLRWNHLFSDRLIGNLSLTYSELRQRASYSQRDSVFEATTGQQQGDLNQGVFLSGIQDWGLRFDGEYFASNLLRLRFGSGASRRVFRPGALVVDEEVSTTAPFDNPRIMTHEFYSYLEGQGQWRKWQWQAGLHQANWLVAGKTYSSWQPRLGLEYQLRPHWQWRATYARMVQYIHLLLNTTVGLPNELWVPTTATTRPGESAVLSVGSHYEFSSNWLLDVEVYYKDMRNLLAFREGINQVADWEGNTTGGRGESYGIETQLTKQGDRLSGWVAYTYSRAFRQFADINRGRIFPFKYDREHDLKMVAMYRLSRPGRQRGPDVFLSANWLLSSGFKFTIPFIRLELGLPGEIRPGDFDPVVYDPESKNRYRMPLYHRFDVNLRLEWNRDKTLQHSLNVGVYNLYNRNNPLYYDVRRVFVNRDNVLTESYSFVEVQLTPILPSLSYRLQF